MNSLIFLGVMVSMIMANVNQLTKVTAETGVGNDVFKVVVTLFGITNSTKYITTLVNVKDETKVKLFNAENPEREHKDTISYTMTFPNLQVNDGDPYKVCTVSVEDFKLNCIDGNNSPLTRPEFVDVSQREGSSDENEDNEEDDEDVD